MSIYKLLNNEQWLKEKYLVEKLSTLKISKLVGCKVSNSVRQSLVKFNIPIRGFRDAQIINTIDGVIIDADVLCGTLLGDAHLGKSSKSSKIASPNYQKKCIKEDYTLHIASLLHTNGEEKVNIISNSSKRKDWENYSNECYIFRTNSSDLLKSYYENWYPESNNYKKVIPKNLVLTPKIILYWFMDDGSSTYRNRNVGYKSSGKNWTQKKKQVIIQFCSESFTKLENEYLCDQLNKLGIKSTIRKVNSGGTSFRIFIAQSDTNKFFDLIGPCPVRSMEYKWKII